MQKKQENGEMVTHVSKVEARAGSRTTVTRSILIVSLILIVALMFLVVAGGYFKADQTGADKVNADNSSQATNSAS